MKTETILEAWDIASQETEMYPDDFQKLVRANRIYQKLVNRIERGDRARAILYKIGQAYKWSNDASDFSERVDKILTDAADFIEDLP